MSPFGSFSRFCSSLNPNQQQAQIDTSSPLPHCNIFFSSLLHVSDPPALTRLFALPITVPHGVINTNDSVLITATNSGGGGGTGDGNGMITEFSNIDDPLVSRYLRRAGTGVGVTCDVGRVGTEGSFGDIGQSVSFFSLAPRRANASSGTIDRAAQIIACSLGFLFVLYLIIKSIRRVAAVGRAEMVHLFCVGIMATVCSPFHSRKTKNR